MDKRQSERVQFFQVPQEKDMWPVWVFRQANSESVLGLLVDISKDGLQVLTDKNNPVQEGNYRLDVRTTDSPDGNFVTLHVRQLWMNAEGALYVRNGFSFLDTAHAEIAVKQILDARDSGTKWLRCELMKA